MNNKQFQSEICNNRNNSARSAMIYKIVDKFSNYIHIVEAMLCAIALCYSYMATVLPS